MAKRGRPPKQPVAGVPAAQQALSGPPRKPLTVEFDAIASAAWDEAVELAGDRLTPADGAILASYASAYSMLVAARRSLAPPEPAYLDAETGKPLRGAKLRKAKAAHAAQPWALITATAGGSQKLSPLVSLIATAARDLAKYAAELGLTPNARARVGAGVAPAADAFDAFLLANKRG